MKRVLLFSIAVLMGLVSLACNKQPVKTPKFADCDKDAEVDWAGTDVCAQQNDPDHYKSTGVKIVSSKCKGIHLSHTKDFRVDVLLRKENSTDSCPLQPFEKAFPAISSNGHVHTGKVQDRNAFGCEYEVHFKELASGGTCDPHIDIAP